MIVDEVVLRLVRATLRKPFENRWQRYDTWTKLLVEVRGEGDVGLAECSAMETPFYSYETIETAWYILNDYLCPMLLARPFHSVEDPRKDWDEVCGHEEAKGALECAVWDLAARLAGQPLYRHLGGEARLVSAGATVGIQPSPDHLVARVREAHDDGYGRVRIKIRPGWDTVPIAAVRSALPEVPLMADANGAYGPDHLGQLSAFDGFGLLALEQPFPRGLEHLSAELQSRLATPIALDESIGSAGDVERMVKLGSGRIVNVKIGRVGGLAEAKKVHDVCADQGVPNFVGAKWDLAIGRWTNIALATLPNMTLPSDVGASDRYYVDDVASVPVTVSKPGWVTPLPGPGIGTDLYLDRPSLDVVRSTCLSR